MSTMWAYMGTAERGFGGLPQVPLTILEYPAEGDMNHICIRCGTELVSDENISQKMFDKGEYLCRDCLHYYGREYRAEYNLGLLHRSGKCQPMGKNKKCAQYLGTFVAERVLSHVFKDVERMPYGNPGYDFVCNGGKKIDVKSSCRQQDKVRQVDHWTFIIKKNKIAEYFLCLAFDNREDLNPEHIWLIPGDVINWKTGTTISETTVDKWAKYALDIERVSSCCDVLKGE